jgi:predicted  nucleic acid-binding Zn-ribbon protein
MNGISIDSTKLLTEKLSLARELVTLKPELDHLRSQAAYQQTLLAEKLALQRQVSTLEVEVETEKRASRRAGHKEKESENEAELHKKVDELRKELAKERREREKAQAAAERSLSEGEKRKAAMESKIEQLRAKLRETKDQVKGLQISLAQAQATATKATTVSANGEVHVTDSRKRNAVQISTDVALCTPDGVAIRAKRLAARRGKSDQTLLGEKSTFSITPFLNRTIGVGSEMPPHDQITKHESTTKRERNGPTLTNGELFVTVEETAMDTKGDAPDPLSPLLKHTNKTAEKAILTDSKRGRVNAKASVKKSCIVGTLEKVIEEGVDENTVLCSAAVPFKALKRIPQQQAKVLDDVEPKKKKRKLLGTVKTLFDEEDGEATKRPAKVSLGPVRSLGKGGLAGGKIGVQSGLGAVTGAVGAFSPLKKDKRGGQASFLA